MILPFSLKLNDQPTYFVEKITQGLSNYAATSKEMMDYSWPKNKHYTHPWNYRNDFKDKIHTMRTDEKNRWKAGNKIHMVVNNRTNKIWRFAPVVPCVSTQEVRIVTTRERYMVLIDGVVYAVLFADVTYITSNPMIQKMNILAHNDGFEDYSEFMRYFNTDWKGKLIHWTDLRY